MNIKNIFKTGLEIAELVSIKNPIALLVIKAIKSIVAKKEDGISNESVVEIVKESAKSKWNDLNEHKVSQIIEIINGVPYERK
jgi:hypothetical protein